MVQNVSMVPGYNVGQVRPRQVAKYSPTQIDMKTLYTPQEIKEITSKFPCLTPNVSNPYGSRIPDNIEVVYLPDAEAIILNNTSMTNHTVEIDKNGHAISVGSWHRTDLEGNYSDLIENVKSRVNQNNKIYR